MQDLTDLSTFRSQITHLDNGWFTLSDVMAEVIEYHASQLSRKGLEIVVEEEEPDLQVFSDRKRARHAFLHLLAYAMQYSEQGRIRIIYARRFDQLEVNILDIGQDIDANQLARLEEALHQNGGARREWDPSVGLYIYLAQELIRLLGGRIDVASAPKQRLQFKITLPLTHS